MLLLAFVLAASSVYVVTPPSSTRPSVLDQDRCANATSHLAQKPAVLRGDPTRPQKLSELPPAETYAAVYRLENGCAVPVLYRDTQGLHPPKR